MKWLAGKGISRRFHQRLAIAIFGVLATTAVWADPPEDNDYDRSNASRNQLILRSAPANVQPIADQYGLNIVGETEANGTHMAVVKGPEQMTAEQIEELIADDPRVESCEPIQLAALPGLEAGTGAPLDTSDVEIELLRSGYVQTPCLNQWGGYADQESARLIRAADAHSYGCGTATVAVLDTGIDPNHPALADALVPGYDFLSEQPGMPSEWEFLGGSLEPILEGSLEPILEGLLKPILEQSTPAVTLGQGEVLLLESSTSPFIDPELAGELEGAVVPPYFGHGTMVAGLIRLTAPGAKIMPLRVFDSLGSAHLFDIVRAIYYAVDNGADVINMSFSMPERSPELKRAVRYARQRGVICVAAAGNDGENARVYPAAYPGTVGVAATTLEDELSEFSNYGNHLVELAAPGSGVISTYPGGVFGAGWGTSFSTPLVAGTLALIHDLNNDGNILDFLDTVHHLKRGSEEIEDLTCDVGSGRLDTLSTVLEAQCW